MAGGRNVIGKKGMIWDGGWDKRIRTWKTEQGKGGGGGTAQRNSRKLSHLKTWSAGQNVVQEEDIRGDPLNEESVNIQRFDRYDENL